MQNLYPSTPTALHCPTCGRTGVHDRRGCRLCRDDALDHLVDAVAAAERLTDG